MRAKISPRENQTLNSSLQKNKVLNTSLQPQRNQHVLATPKPGESENSSISLHVENLEGDLERTWNALRSRTISNNESTDLSEIVDILKENSLKSGIGLDEAESEAQVTALISSLFLTHRGYAEVSQDSEGNISLKNLHLDDDDFSTLTNRINPKSKLPGGIIFNE